LGGIGYLYFLSVSEAANEFLFPIAAYAKMALAWDHLQPVNLGGISLGKLDTDIGYQLIIILLAKITGLPVEQLIFLPIGGIATFIVLFIFSAKMLHSHLLALLISLVVIITPSFSIGLYNVFYYGWTVPLYLTSVMLLLNLIERRQKSTCISLILIFAGLQYYHPTPTSWVIATVAGSILFLQFKRERNRALQRYSLIRIFMIFIAIYLTLNTLPYTLLARASSSHFILDPLIHQFYALLGGTTTEGVEALESGPFPYGYLKVSYHAITLLAIASYPLILLVSKLRRNRRYRTTSTQGFSSHSLLVWVALFTAFLHSLGYLIFGRFSLKYNLAFFPFVAVLALHLTHRSMRVKTSILVLLLTLNFGQALIFWNPASNMVSSYTYSDLRPSLGRLATNIRDNSSILTDFYTGGALLLESSSEINIANVIFFDWNTYSLLVEPTHEAKARYSSLPDLVLLNVGSSQIPTPMVGWNRLPPLYNYLDSLSNDMRFNLVQNDAILWALSLSSASPVKVSE
jgi:hypothetical protein